MSKFDRRSLRWSTAVAIFVASVAPPAFAGHNGPNIGGIFGAILNNALSDQMRGAWQNRPTDNYNCLEAHNMSADQLAASGIGPNDPRVQRIFAQCAAAAASRVTVTPALTPTTGRYNPDFNVFGIAPGGSVDPSSNAYQAYSCKPSEQFPGFKWCSVRHPMTGKFGPYDSWETVLHSDENTAVLILQDVLPAYFAPGDVEGEIQRLSNHFGQAARVFNGDPRPGASHSLIAVWGDVTLTPLGQSDMDALRRDETITAGLVVDFLSDSKKSAKEGMPVFHIGGGGGYVYAVKYDDSGKGGLRIVAVNSSLLPSPDQPPLAYTAPATPSPAMTTLAAPTVDPAQAEKERAERVDRATVAANAQIEDAGAFIKEHPQSSNLLDYVDKISALSKAVKGGDPGEIDRKSTELSNALNHDRDFQQHVAESAEAQKRRDAQYLGDAIHHGEKQRAFILDYIGKNPLADATPGLASYVKQLNAALQRPSLNVLQELVGKVDLAIREDNLANEFIALQSAAPQSAAPLAPVNATEIKPEAAPKPSADVASEALPETDKNRFLLKGNLGDVEILYNASPNAPHVARNLRGDFVFDKNQANVCLFGQNPEGFALTVKGAIATFSSQNGVTVNVESCNTERLISYDIIAMQRNAFLRTKRDEAFTFLKMIETSSFKRFAEISAADLEKVTDSERALIEKVKTMVGDGAPDGYGVVLLDTNSPNLCLAAGGKIKSHQELLVRAESKLNLAMRTQVVIKDTSIDEAFLNVQKRQCGAVYASAADLKALTEALAHNEIAYSFASLWILPQDVVAAEALLAEKDRVAAQEETERLQRNADQVKIASMRAHDLNATQAAQQAALREKFGDSAKAAAAALSAEVIAWTKDQSGQIASAFPSYAMFVSGVLADHWEVMTIDNSLEDFGRSNFKNRSLDTVFARVTVHLKNRMLGDYHDACFIFGRINDTEFSMSREFVDAKCDDEARVRAWQTGHEFKSEWIASN